MSGKQQESILVEGEISCEPESPGSDLAGLQMCRIGLVKWSFSVSLRKRKASKKSRIMALLCCFHSEWLTVEMEEQ